MIVELGIGFIIWLVLVLIFWWFIYSATRNDPYD